jgi:transposase InsO family protein
MGSIQHANATTTARIRKEIQDSSETISALAQRLSLNPKTVSKWRKAGRVEDLKSGPSNPHSTVLSALDEQLICEFRRQTKLPLDDVFVSLKDKIKGLTRSNLHRCLQRHGLSRLPPEDKGAREKKKFKDYPIGYVHVDITEVRVGAQKLYLFVGIDRVCKYVYVELHERMTQAAALSFLRNLIQDFPFIIHRLLTDNGSQFTYALLAERLRPKNKKHPFDALCEDNGITHKLTQFRHPWTNGQVEVLNRVIKKHTTKTYHYDTVEQLKQHLMSFVLVYNFQRPLRALKHTTPYAKILQTYETNPELFRSNPNQKIVGLNR